MESELRLLYRAYDAFNARDLDAALAAMTPDVEWPNVAEGRTLLGHEAVRDYWTRQWREIDPHVRPIGYLRLPDERLRLEVQLTVRSLGGDPLSMAVVGHVYTFRDGLIARMEMG